MPYQGSAQSVGFRSRATPDTSKRMRQKAQDLEKRRVDEVNSMQKQASGQLQEMQRIDSLASKKDQYELDNLRKFSSTLNEFLDTSAKTIGKAYIDNKREEGIDLERKVRSGDKEAIAKVKESDEQVIEIEKRVEEQTAKTAETIDKIEFAKNLRHDLITKQRLLNARKLGSNIYWGYRKGYLQEAKKNFISDLENRLTNDTTVVEVGGYKGPINEARGEDKRAVADYLQNEYISKHGDDINQNVVRRVLTRGTVNDLGKWKDREYQYDNRQQALEERDGLTIKIQNGIENIDTDPSGFNIAYQSLLTRGYSIAKRMGSSQPGVDAKKYALEILVDEMSELKQGSHKNIDDMEDLLTNLENHEFTIPGLGSKTLSGHWGEDFSTTDLRAKAIELQHARYNKEQNGLKIGLNTAVKDAQEQYQLDIQEGNEDAKEVYQKSLALAYENFNEYVGIETTMESAKKWKPSFISEREADLAAETLLAEYGNEIPLSETKSWPIESKEKYKDQIVENTFASDEKGVKIRSNAETQIDRALTKAYGTLSKTDRNQNDLERAKKWTKLQLTQKAKDFLLTGDAKTEHEALKMAGDFYLGAIRADNPTDGNNPTGDGTFSVIPNEGFANPAFRDPAPTEDPLDRLGRQSRIVEKTEDLVNSTNRDVFKTERLVTNPVDLELDAHGQPRNVYYSLAKVDPKNRTAHEILNAQREANNLEPLKWDENTQAMIDLRRSQNPQIQADLASGNSNRISRAVDTMGLVDLRTLHNAVLGSELVINPAELDENLANAGMTRAEYNTPNGKIKFVRHRINYLMDVAATKTDNKDVLIRMVAVGLTSDEHNMLNTWNSPDANGERSLAVLQNYYSGSNHLPKDITYDTRELQPETGAVSIIEEDSSKTFKARLESQQFKLRDTMKAAGLSHKDVMREIGSIKKEAREIRRKEKLSYDEYFEVLIKLYNQRLIGGYGNE